MKTEKDRELIIIGDRVLITPDTGDKTDSGLYLPPGLKEKEKVQSGYIVKIGPGYQLPHQCPNSDDRFAIRKLTFNPTLLDDRFGATAAVLRQGVQCPLGAGPFAIMYRSRRSALVGRRAS